MVGRPTPGRGPPLGPVRLLTGDVRRIDANERRARLASRHGLAAPATDLVAAAGQLIGFHSSDTVSVYLSARARLADFAVADLEDALYQQRSLVRMLGMRRTMFVVPVECAAVIDAACTRALAPAERRRLVKMLEDQGIAEDGTHWLGRVCDATMAALATRGEATAAELTEEVPELGLKLSFGAGKKWAGTVGVSTRVLFLLAAEGMVVRGRPLGSWVSRQYRWSPMATWLDGGPATMEAAAARRALLERWLRAFGPGTLTDLRWWTGWTVKQTEAAVSAVGAVEVRLDEGTGYVLADDLDPTGASGPGVALLPALDATVMGWKERSWYLGDHTQWLFDRNGNAGPTVWFEGRVVGGWGQRADGEVAVRLLEDVGRDAEASICAEAERLSAWLDPTRVTPLFRTPLERELADS